mgnify:CR=1 FL=1
MNFLKGYVINNQLQLDDNFVQIPEDKLKMLKDNGYEGKEVVLGIRQEDIYDASSNPNYSNEFNIEIRGEVAELMGAKTIVYGEGNGQNLVSRIDARTGILAGSTMKLYFDMDNSHFFDIDTELRIK